MSELTLMILRIGLLLLLWAFIFAIVYALRSDLFGAPVRKLKGDAANTPHVQPIVSAGSGGAGSGGAGTGGPGGTGPGGPGGVAPVPFLAAPVSPGAATGLALTAPVASVITPSGGALPSAGGSGAPQNLVITTGVASGASIPLDENIFTIGRSSESSLVIVDEYTSTYHARLAFTGGEWILTDLDSTNGTRLDGVRVTKSVPVPPFTPITIGTTTFELRP